jgi:hypothetical protein
VRLKLREIPGAYIGKHCEIVGALGQRVYPPPPARLFRHPGTGVEVPLGTDRGACLGFLAGYEYARAEGSK